MGLGRGCFTPSGQGSLLEEVPLTLNSEVWGVAGPMKSIDGSTRCVCKSPWVFTLKALGAAVHLFVQMSSFLCLLHISETEVMHLSLSLQSWACFVNEWVNPQSNIIIKYWFFYPGFLIWRVWVLGPPFPYSLKWKWIIVNFSVSLVNNFLIDKEYIWGKWSVIWEIKF